MALLDDILALPASIRNTQDTKQITEALSPVPVLGLVDRADLSIWAASNGMRAKVEDHANDVTSPLRSAALAFRDVLLGAASGIDFSIPANLLMLNAWVSAGVLSQVEADKLKALATQYIPYTEYEVRRVCWSDYGVWKV